MLMISTQQRRQGQLQRKHALCKDAICDMNKCGGSVGKTLLLLYDERCTVWLWTDSICNASRLPRRVFNLAAENPSAGNILSHTNCRRRLLYCVTSLAWFSYFLFPKIQLEDSTSTITRLHWPTGAKNRQ
jgi:hypothetical protein